MRCRRRAGAGLGAGTGTRRSEFELFWVAVSSSLHLISSRRGYQSSLAMHRLGFLPSSSSSLSLFAYHPIVPIFILILILIAGHPSLASISCCATCSVLHYSHLGSVLAHVDMSCPPHRTVCIRILTSQLLVFISFSHLSLFLDVFCPLSCTIISVCLCLRLSSLCILLSLSLSLALLSLGSLSLSSSLSSSAYYAYAYAYLPRSTSNPPHFQNSNFSSSPARVPSRAR